MIVLERSKAPRAAGGQGGGLPERPPPARHWRRWRHGGTALSAILHALVLVAFTVSMPRPNRAEHEPERTIPVEIVQREPEAPEVPPETPKETEKDKEAEKAKEAERAKAKEAERQKAEAKEKEAEKPAQREARKSPEPPPAAPTPPAVPPAHSPPASPLTQPERPPSPPLWTPAPPPIPPMFAEREPRAPAPPPAAPPAPKAGPNGGQIVSADDDSAPPDAKKVVGMWVLDPLTVDLRDRCGLARITATMVLTERIAEGHYRGTLRNRVVWASCAPTGALYGVELRITGSEAQMIGANFTDRGVIRGNVMMLEDAYGRSVWRKR